MELNTLFYSCVIGILITLITIIVLKPFAIALKLVDSPGGRKLHPAPTPIIGGIAMYIGLFVSLFSSQVYFNQNIPMLMGGLLLLIIGILDDRHDLSARLRILGQAIATGILILWGHLSAQNLGDLFFTGNLSLASHQDISFLITLIAVIGFINATNMIDGLDGLAGLITLSQTSFLVYLAIRFSAYQEAYCLLILASLICTYLVFNMRLPWRKHASIFMGDAGSTFIAFIIAWFAIALSQQALKTSNQHLGFNLVTILWILAFPLYDLLSVIICRIKNGESPFTPGRDHFHHFLIKKGFSTERAVWSVVSFSSLLSFLGISLAKYQVCESWQLVLFLTAFTGYLCSIHYHLSKNISYPEKNQSSAYL